MESYLERLIPRLEACVIRIQETLGEFDARLEKLEKTCKDLTKRVKRLEKNDKDRELGIVQAFDELHDLRDFSRDVARHPEDHQRWD